MVKLPIALTCGGIVPVRALLESNLRGMRGTAEPPRVRVFFPGEAARAAVGGRPPFPPQGAAHSINLWSTFLMIRLRSRRPVGRGLA